MRLNRRMQRYLADLRSREVEAALPSPGKGPDVQIVEARGCFLLNGFVKKPHLSPADFPDATTLECSANKLRMEGMFPARIVASCPLLLLTAGMLTARLLSVELARREARFNVILSYDGESCAVRFHKIRAGERWLLEDLEEYADEGVLVFEAGRDAPAPALLMAPS
jgi:hypothetical protein